MICTQVDNWLKTHMEENTVWIVKLSDGTIVYQDDDRPDSEGSAWARLKKHCEYNRLYITEMKLKFRSHVVHMESDADGYYFSRGVRATFGAANQGYYAIGTVEKNASGNYNIHVDKWQTPELEKFALDGETEIRKIDEKNMEAIIVRPGIQITK